MSNDDILEQSSQDESGSVDIAELLKAANSKVFDDQNNLIDTNKNFEKVSSFFDLIKSSNSEDANLLEQDLGSEGSSEDVLDGEELAEDTSLDNSGTGIKLLLYKRSFSSILVFLSYFNKLLFINIRVFVIHFYF